MNKCAICEETINKQDLELTSQSTLKGEPAHDECKQSQEEYASTLFEFTPEGEIFKTIFDEDFIFESDKEIYDELPNPIKNQKWVSTDAWRGYTDWELEKGFISVGDGWITGYPDGTTQRKVELSDIYDKLQKGELIPPVTIYWIFGHTSNLFSTASEVIISENDKEIFEKWLKTFNGDLAEFQSKFA